MPNPAAMKRCVYIIIAFVSPCYGFQIGCLPKQPTSHKRTSNGFLVEHDHVTASSIEKDKQQTSSEWTRRKLIISEILSTMAYANTVLADEVSNDEPTECKDGGIVSESAVPGAYQNQCMNLAERTFLLKSTNEKITIQQGLSSNGGVAGKTGAAVWNSGIILTRLLDRMNQLDPTFLKDKSIFELGCGVALASIAAAKLGASNIYATDNNPEVLSLARRNLERNNASNAKTALLQWGLLDAFEFDRCADVIIGSDLTYNPNTWRALAESMVTILKPGGMVIYLSLGHSGFNVAGELSGFTSVAENVGLKKVNDKGIESLLPQVLSPDERNIMDANGGARALILTKK